jgi:hypothetical protein
MHEELGSGSPYSQEDVISCLGKVFKPEQISLAKLVSKNTHISANI